MDTITCAHDTGPAGTGWLTTITGLLRGETLRDQYTPWGEVSLLTAMAMAVPDGPTPLPLHDTRTYTANGDPRYAQKPGRRRWRRGHPGG